MRTFIIQVRTRSHAFAVAVTRCLGAVPHKLGAFLDAPFTGRMKLPFGRCTGISIGPCTMKKSDLAFTRMELLFCLVGATLVTIPAVSLLASNKSESHRAVCFNNLRQIGQAFQSWASEHNDNNYVFRTPYPEGTKNYPFPSLMNSAWFHFASLSNQLGSPKLLVCPADTGAARAANNWGFGPDGFLNAGLRANALSYSLHLEAFPMAPRTILSGDRNIRATSFPVSCSSGATFCAGLGINDAGLRWTNDVHGVSGHLLFSDGSVAFTSPNELRSAISLFPGDTTEVHLLPAR